MAGCNKILTGSHKVGMVDIVGETDVCSGREDKWVSAVVDEGGRTGADGWN